MNHFYHIYRGITIMSCLGKLFTSVINARLTKFVENIELIGAEQAGFRKGFSTADHIFTFKCILDLYSSRKKKLFCAFIDYKKAFDSVAIGAKYPLLVMYFR